MSDPGNAPGVRTARRCPCRSALSRLPPRRRESSGPQAHPLLSGAGLSNHATRFTPFARASDANRNAGLLSKKMSALDRIPHPMGLVLSTATESTDPGTKYFERGSRLSSSPTTASRTGRLNAYPISDASPSARSVPPFSTNDLIRADSCAASGARQSAAARAASGCSGASAANRGSCSGRSVRCSARLPPHARHSSIAPA